MAGKFRWCGWSLWLAGALLLPIIVGAQPPAAVASEVNQLLQPGDLVRLRIWREPDLSGDFRVDEKTVAIFPKIGPLAVGHLPTDSLRSLLVSGYSRFLQDPSVEVTFLRRVNVLGEVRNPGLYHVDPTMSLTDVLAMAGGMNSDANRSKIELIRGDRSSSISLSTRSNLTATVLRSGDQLRVSQRSWLSRNAGVVAAGITGMAVILTAVISQQ